MSDAITAPDTVSGDESEADTHVITENNVISDSPLIQKFIETQEEANRLQEKTNKLLESIKDETEGASVRAVTMTFVLVGVTLFAFALTQSGLTKYYWIGFALLILIYALIVPGHLEIFESRKHKVSQKGHTSVIQQNATKQKSIKGMVSDVIHGYYFIMWMIIWGISTIFALGLFLFGITKGISETFLAALAVFAILRTAFDASGKDALNRHEMIAKKK